MVAADLGRTALTGQRAARAAKRQPGIGTLKRPAGDRTVAGRVPPLPPYRPFFMDLTS